MTWPCATATRTGQPGHAEIRFLHRLENGLAGVALAAAALLPLGEIAARQFGTGVPGAAAIVQHLTLWIAFLGAAMAAREKRLLALATGELLPGRWRRWAGVIAATFGAAASALLFRGALELLLIEREGASTIAFGLPVWVGQLVMPFAFAAIALRLVWRADPAWTGRAVAGLGLLAGLALGHFPDMLAGGAWWPGIVLLIAAGTLGMPLFAVIGGAAALLFLADGIPLAALPAETYRLAVSPTLAAIPLFTLAGFLLAEGHAAERLLRVFRSFFGWLPGGTAIVAALIFAFFTVFTGGSGVTILAIGALAYSALRADGYHERFSIGLLTSSASLGLLLPPALPLILYGIVAGVSIEDLFIAGIVPGLLLIALTAAWGVRAGLRLPKFVPAGGDVPAGTPQGAAGPSATRPRMSARESLDALRGALWELLLPVVVLVAIFGGFATLVEAAALSAAYAFVMQVFVRRELSLTSGVPRVLTAAAVLLGGVLIILAVAMGLTSYLVDAQVPALALDWVQERVDSRIVFLLLLNIFLLVVGCMMDIFSATVVVAPLLVPLGLAFGIDPVHLGIIFIANLELGYLTPPVGLNLFLAAYRFERKLGEVSRAVLPFLIIRAAGVALVTYVPLLSVGVLRALGR
jgi:C4-dicarboxylate transporter, DctM subunit